MSLVGMRIRRMKAENILGTVGFQIQQLNTARKFDSHPVCDITGLVPKGTKKEIVEDQNEPISHSLK